MGCLQRIRLVCLWLAVALVFQVSTAAGSPVEELAKRMPDNTIGFVATSGGDSLKADFEKSILGRLWNDPNLQAFATPLWTQLRTAMFREVPDPNAPKQLDMALGYAALVASRPIIIGAAQVQARVKKGPPVCGFAIVDAGDRKQALTDALARLEAQAEKGDIVEVERDSFKLHSVKDENDVPLYWGWVGSYFVVAANDAENAVLKYVSKPRADVPDYFGKVTGTDDAVMVHCDFSKMGQVVKPLIEEETDEPDFNDIVKVLTQLGLDKVSRLTARAGFSGPDLVSDEFIAVPEPRTGLLGAFKSVDLALFGLVDPNAVEAGAVNCDISAIYDVVMGAIKTIAPEEDYAEIQEALADAESEVKVAIRKDLLGSLAGPVVFYSLPAGKMLDAPTGGSVAVVKLKDPAAFEKTMVSLGRYISEKSGGSFQVSDMNDSGQTKHIWSIPALALLQLQPTWSIVGDNFVIGSSSALHQMELKYLATGGKRPASLLDNEGYKKIASRLPRNLMAFTYVDSQAQFSQMMIGIQQLWPFAVMMATQAKIALPVMLPNLDRVIKQMQPGCRYGYFDTDGLHFRYQGTGVEASLGAVAGGSMAVGIMLPAVARVRQLSQRREAGTNLAAIGKACLVYTNDHNDTFPMDLETLVKDGKLSANALESKRKPKGFGGPSYVYIAGQTVAMNPGNILAYENPEFCLDGTNVLFLDMHVEFVKPDQFREELAATYKRLGREMPPIHFKDEAKPVLPKGPGA
jgi:hypothetical protein